MNAILEDLRKSNAYQAVLKSARQRGPFDALRLPRAARLPFVAALQQDLGCDLILLTDRDDHALILWEELAFWTDATRLHFAEPNPLFYERAPWSAAVRRERLQVLSALAGRRLPGPTLRQDHAIVIASARALMTRTVPRENFLGAYIRVSSGARIPSDLTRHGLVASGYARSNVVLEPGEFAMRGGILDVWAPGFPAPMRIELVGDEVNSIRRFDPVSQRTVELVQSNSAAASARVPPSHRRPTDGCCVCGGRTI